MKIKITESQYQIIIESESINYFKSKSNIYDFDKVLNNETQDLPKKYENWKGEIVWMTMEEYLKECALLQNTTYADQLNFIIERKVDYIAAKMQNGTKFDMPYLNYIDNEQEGRHRVMAATELGQTEIPVLVLYEDDEEEYYPNDDISSMIGVWDDLVEINNNYYCVFPDTNFKSVNKLLSCIVSDYDYYYLDNLMSIAKYPTLYHNLNNYLTLSLDDKNIISFQGADAKKLKDFVVIYKIMKNNFDLFLFDTILIKNDKLYLKILDDIKVNLNDFNSSEELLTKVVGDKYYVKEYNLLSIDDKDKIYNQYLTENDIKSAVKIYKEGIKLEYGKNNKKSN